MTEAQHFNAVYAFNSYTFKLLKENLGWNKADYDGRTPIIPAAQQPEFNDIGKDFIVYTSVINPAPDLWPIQSETLAYTIYSRSTTAADKIVDLLVAAYQRQDESADNVNKWLDVERASGSNNKRLVGFTNVHSTLGEKSNPPDQEEGLYSAVVMINLMYIILPGGPNVTKNKYYFTTV